MVLLYFLCCELKLNSHCLQRDALQDDSYGLQEPSPELMDMSQSGPAEQYEEDEDEMYMQQAPNDTLIALQLLRSQFPAKARVGTLCTAVARFFQLLPFLDSFRLCPILNLQH